MRPVGSTFTRPRSGEPDGPVKFHYPARPMAEDYGLPAAGGGAYFDEGSLTIVRSLVVRETRGSTEHRASRGFIGRHTAVALRARADLGELRAVAPLLGLLPEGDDRREELWERPLLGVLAQQTPPGQPCDPSQAAAGLDLRAQAVRLGGASRAHPRSSFHWGLRSYRRSSFSL